MPDTALPSRDPSRAPGRRGWSVRRRSAAAGSALVVAAAGGALAWWASHPDDLFDRGYRVASPRDPGETLWASVARIEGDDVPGPVVVTGLSPRVRMDSADASVDYVVCVLDTDYMAAHGVGTFPFGGRGSDLDDYCVSTRPAIGATLGRGEGTVEEVLVGVTPRHEGRSLITGHQVDYRIGWQRGHATIPVTTDVRSPGRPGRGRQAPRPSR